MRNFGLIWAGVASFGLLVASCATDTASSDATSSDATVGVDTAGNDTTAEDTASTDSGLADTSADDTSVTDSAGTDTTIDDTSVTDSAGTDTTIDDTSATDSAGTDTAIDDISVADSAAEDTGADDVGQEDTGPDCSGPGTQTVCVEGVPNKVYKTDACGNATVVKSSCSSKLACEVNSGDGQAYCACPLTGKNTCKLGGTLSTLYEVTYIVKERACASAVPDPGDFVEDCGFGSVCFQDDQFNGGEALCHRSIDASQADKPYYDFGCGKFSMWLLNPTHLEVDCRCRITGDGQGGAGGTGSGYVDPNNIDIDNGGFPGGPIINCAPGDKMANTAWPVEFGEGPSFNAWFQQNSSGASWFSGDVDPETREMYGIVKWTNPQYVKSATVVAWNLDTKDRRVISGLYPDPKLGQQMFGSGYMSPKVGNTGTATEQPLSGAHVLRIGPDDMIYTFGGGTGESSSSTREIVRIDPETGERTLMWLAQNPDTGDITGTWGQCFRPDVNGDLESVSLQSQAFEVGPDGTFYVSMHGVREGDGILSISSDGQTCTYHSRWGGLGHDPGGGVTPVPAPDQIGEGFALQFPVQGLLFHGGVIHGVSNDDLYSFDLTTGQRIKESYTKGVYGGMGFANMFWDPSREVIWAVGTVATYVGSIVDLTTGKREPVFGDSEYGADAIMQSMYGTAQSVSTTMLSNGNSIGYGGFILDPANNDIVYAVLKSGGLMMMELSTFNNFVVSW